MMIPRGKNNLLTEIVSVKIFLENFLTTKFQGITLKVNSPPVRFRLSLDH